MASSIQARAIAAIFTLSLALAPAGCGTGNTGQSSGGGPSAPGASTLSTGPQLGYVWDTGVQALRPILGVPGASQVGALVPASMRYVFAAASPRTSVAVLIAADGSVETQALPGSTPSLLGGVTAVGGSRIVFSPAGANALIYAPGVSTVTLLTNLTTTPQAQTLRAPANLLGAAVSDTALVAVVAGNGTLQLSLVGGGSSLASLSGYGGVNFLPGADDLVAADSAANSLVLVWHSSSNPAAKVIASSLLKAPVDVAASQDGRWAVAANSADASVVRIDLSGQTSPLRVACNCQPKQVKALSGNAVYLLQPLAAGPTWLVDASSTVPETLFIPAAHIVRGQQ